MGISGADAQSSPGNIGSRFKLPDKIVLYIHQDLKRTSFIDPLICALKSIFIPPVELKTISLPLGTESLATPTQYNATKLARRFYQATSADAQGRPFRFLLLPHDLKGGPYRYLFSAGFGSARTSHHVSVMSTARLDTSGSTGTDYQGANVTSLRLYKLIVRTIARFTGLSHSNGCVLGFPRNLYELDQKSADYCPKDRVALVEAGLLKSRPSGAACSPMVQTAPSDKFFVLSRIY